MRVQVSYFRDCDLPPAEVEKVFAASDARARLALIQQGCKAVEDLPSEVHSYLEWQLNEAMGDLRSRFADVRRAIWISDPATMPPEIQPKV